MTTGHPVEESAVTLSLRLADDIDQCSLETLPLSHWGALSSGFSFISSFKTGGSNLNADSSAGVESCSPVFCEPELKHLPECGAL